MTHFLVISGEAVRTTDDASAQRAGAMQHDAGSHPLPLQRRARRTPRGQEQR